MKAGYLVSHGDLSVVKVGDLPLPGLGPGQVLVKMKYASLNHLDIWVRKGFPGLKLSFPHILGSDGAGVIEALGNGVSDWKVGQEVIVHPSLSCGKCPECIAKRESLCPQFLLLGEQVNGMFCEYLVIPSKNVFARPSCLKLSEAASIALVFTTAWEMLVRKAQVKEGDLVLIHGIGSGVSTAAVQIARSFGARVSVTSRSLDKIRLAKKWEIENGFIASEDFGKEFKKAYGRGPDIIFDHVGAALWEKNIRLLRSGGTLVTCGATTGNQATTDLAHVFFRQLRIWGSTMGDKSDFGEILRRFDTGEFTPVVDKVFSLSELAQAQAYLEEGNQMGKVVLSI